MEPLLPGGGANLCGVFQCFKQIFGIRTFRFTSSTHIWFIWFTFCRWVNSVLNLLSACIWFVWFTFCKWVDSVLNLFLHARFVDKPKKVTYFKVMFVLFTIQAEVISAKYLVRLWTMFYVTNPLQYQKMITFPSILLHGSAFVNSSAFI